MNFFKFLRRDPRPGSAAHALDVAEYVRRTDGDIAGPSDRTLVEGAPRSRAACGLRRITVGLVGDGMAILMIVGVEDRNGDARVDIADLVIGIWSAVPALAKSVQDEGRR